MSPRHHGSGNVGLNNKLSVRVGVFRNKLYLIVSIPPFHLPLFFSCEQIVIRKSHKSAPSKGRNISTTLLPETLHCHVQNFQPDFLKSTMYQPIFFSFKNPKRHSTARKKYISTEIWERGKINHTWWTLRLRFQSCSPPHYPPGWRRTR